MRIVTSHDRPPIPTTAYDWSAYRDGQCFCPECAGKVPVGHGPTKEAAVADLLQQEAEREPLFTHSEQEPGAEAVPLSVMLADNEDEDIREWLERARVGATLTVGGGAAALVMIRRVA